VINIKDFLRYNWSLAVRYIYIYIYISSFFKMRVFGVCYWPSEFPIIHLTSFLCCSPYPVSVLMLYPTALLLFRYVHVVFPEIMAWYDIILISCLTKSEVSFFILSCGFSMGDYFFFLIVLPAVSVVSSFV
jgi:hypothetical protein